MRNKSHFPLLKRSLGLAEGVELFSKIEGPWKSKAIFTGGPEGIIIGSVGDQTQGGQLSMLETQCRGRPQMEGPPCLYQEHLIGNPAGCPQVCFSSLDDLILLSTWVQAPHFSMLC